MRRVLFPIMGVLEGAVAVVLVWFGLQLPSHDEVAAGFQSADHVTSNAEKQVKILRRQVQELRRPELMQLAERLQSQTQTVTANVKDQPLDFETVQTMHDALAEIAESLDGVARTLGPSEREREVRRTLQRSAGLLRQGSGQLKEALRHRDGYEQTFRQSVALAETFAAMLPLLTEQLDSRLAEEEHALDELDGSLREARTVLPVYAQSTAHVLQSGRLLAWLGATIAAMHGVYLLMSARLGRRYSG
jgi:hypothetical protein